MPTEHANLCMLPEAENIVIINRFNSQITVQCTNMHCTGRASVILVKMMTLLAPIGNPLHQGSQTRGPRAACGPRRRHLRPATHYLKF